MQVYLNEVSGLWQALVGMYMSRRTWTREREIYTKCLFEQCYDRWGKCLPDVDLDVIQEMDNLVRVLLKWAPKHITMTRFLDFSFTVEGMHRGAQDDLDSHARRMENRILRSSTRLAKYGAEKSDWYKGRILTTDEALSLLGMSVPEEVSVDGVKYARAVNGYVREDLCHDKDTLRGLYMLSIPSNNTFRINCTEFAHLLKERDTNSNAHPELKEAVESMLQQITQCIPQLDREWFYSVKN